MSELIRREDLENWLRTECASIDTYEDKEYVIGRLREDLQTVNSWHRVEEPPKKTAKYLVWVDVNNGVFSAYPELRTAAYNVVYERWYVDGDQRTEWIGTPRYWTPIEPPKEDA